MLGDPPSGMSVVVKCDTCNRIAWVDYSVTKNKPYQWITNEICQCGTEWRTYSIPVSATKAGSIDWDGYHRIPRQEYEHLL